MAILLPPRSPIWFLKLSLLLLTILSLTSLAYLKFPPPTKAQALYTSLKPWLTPPYLFIAIHLIIAILWKLSDYNNHSDHHSPPAEAVENSAKLSSFDSSPAEQLQHEFPMPEPISEPNSEPPPVLEFKNFETMMDVEITKTSGNVEAVYGESVVEEEEEEENESMEETWRAIMEKTATPRTTRRWRTIIGDSNEEMNRRFEDFIKGKRDQLRLERHESNQRRLLAGN